MGDVSTPPATRLTDPSRAVVERIAQEALNPAYAQRTRARSAQGGRRSPSGVVVTVATIALVGVLLSVLVVAARQGASDVESERAGLVSLAGQARTEVEALEQQVEQLSDEVRSLREQALGSQTLGAQRAAEIERLALSAGVAPVAGPGARVVLDDGDTDVGGTDSALSRVLDIDVQQVVNGLWESGAEAVAVNGERVGALTAIRSVQDVILVNYTPIVGPYEVTAIGDPRTLPTDFLRSSGGQWLQAVSLSAGIDFSIDSVGSDEPMSGATVATLRYATAVTEQSTQDAT